MFNNIYKNKTVLLTGHTGFKGSWMALWLQELGAKVIGFSDKLPSEPSHFERLKLDIIDVRGDIRDLSAVTKVFTDYQPEIVFHMAAQPLVRLSYREPIDTFDVNVMGTVKVLEAALHCDSVKAVVNITSDKAYDNKEWVWGYRENDPMGGFDPYSASKGCAELVTSSYRRAFYQNKGKLLASGRAGNVIGGGDWAEDRLVPDIFKAAARGETVKIRNPHATRPWQHVLEPLSGYLLLGQHLLEGNAQVADGWNFGPNDDDTREVANVITHIQQHWKEVKFEIEDNMHKVHEANLLKLDCSKALMQLQWKPVWHFTQTIDKTTNWYKDFYTSNADIIALSKKDLNSYIEDAKKKEISWAL